LLKRADFISLHTPLNEQTKNILNKTSLAKCKKGVRIVNCARGGLVNEEDLKAALESGQVAGAAFDVFAEEPAKTNILFGNEKMVCTPHLGASTNEAQENVALQVAEQISDYLNNGTVTNAVNMPSVSAEDAAKLRPYLELADQLGGFAGQLTETGISAIKIEYEGHVAELNTKPITAVLVKGLLSPLVEGVNMVNAPVVAKDRNIKISEVKNVECDDYQTIIKLTVSTEKRELEVAGTLFGGKKPRIVEVSGIKLEAGLGPLMLYVNNEDKPGLIGNLGKLLGDAGVNIANFNLGRNDKRNDAIALLEIDQPANDDLIKKITKLPSVKQVKVMNF